MDRELPTDPAAREVATDTDRGATALSLAALDALGERARAGETWATVADRARALRDARPAMPAVANRVNRAMASAEERTPAAVARAVATVRDAARRADEAAADAAAGQVGDAVLTLSRSGTVHETLARANLDRVFVTESRPAREGVGTAEQLAADHEVTLLVDAAAPALLATGRVDTVLVGADTVGPDGSVLNKVGTRGLALAAAREDVPCLAVAASDKVSHREPTGEDGDPAAVYDGDADLGVFAPTFDLTPPDLVTVVTEQGVLSTGDLRAVAERHREAARWDEG